MRNQLRFIAVLCVVTLLAAMAFEPFFSALLARLGWDSEAWVDPMLSTVSSIVSHPWFPIIATGLIAFGLGVLLDLAVKAADSLFSRLESEKRNVTETDRKIARERLLEKAIEAIRSAKKDVDNVRPFLEEKFSDRIDPSLNFSQM